MRDVDARAPGRVNLIGDHTDYNDGFVLPSAIDRECRVTAAPSDELIVHWRNDADALSLRIVEAVSAELGVAELTIDSTVPIGAGLSSSAALEVGVAKALAPELEPRVLAELCRRAETAATGVPCGIMDQLASALGVAGHALLIDCRSLEVTPVPLPDDVGVIVVDSGLPRTLAGSAYAERRAACEAIAAHLGLAALRDATLDQVADEPRARHVVTENERVLAAADALRANDLEALGRLMLESHASLRDDYEVSTPELDALVAQLVAAGCAGARLTGAGFGGCVVGVAPAGEADRIAREVSGFVVRAVDGATAG
jgi:galactokinase